MGVGIWGRRDLSRAGGRAAATAWVRALRTEPRQRGGMAHRAVPPFLAPTRERRPSMACLPHTPALPRLSALSGRGFVRCFLPVPEGDAPVERGLPRCLSRVLGHQGGGVGQARLYGRRDLRDDGLSATPIEAMAPTHPRTSSQGGMAQAAHGCAAFARWSRTRNRAMRHTPLGRRPHPELAPPDAVAFAVPVPVAVAITVTVAVSVVSPPATASTAPTKKRAPPCGGARFVCARCWIRPS